MYKHVTFSIRSLLTPIAFFCAFTVAPTSVHSATVRYNDTLYFDNGADFFTDPTAARPTPCDQWGCPRISIDFTYDAATSALSAIVATIFNDITFPSGSQLPINAFDRQLSPNDNIIRGTFWEDGNFRSMSLNTSFIVANNSLDPLSLAFLGVGYTGEAQFYRGGLSGKLYSASSEKLTNLDRVSQVPSPPALLLFASSLVSIGWFGKRRRTN